MNAKELATKYLSEKRVMQLATHDDDYSWSCNVHFYADQELNLYWFSLESREHSKQIARNPKVSAALFVHEDTPDERYVIGVSISGTAELGADIEQAVRDAYFEKAGTPPAVKADIESGKKLVKMYKLTPSRIVLFDTKNFPKDPRQEISLN